MLNAILWMLYARARSGTGPCHCVRCLPMASPPPSIFSKKGRSAAGAVNSFRNKDRKLGCGCAGSDPWIHHESVSTDEHTSELQPLMRISDDVFCSTKNKRNN